MLSDSNVCATIAVKDLPAARKFYEEVLGLHDTVMDADYAVVYKSGDSMIQVYPSQYAGTNQATAATWEVSDINYVIDDLKSKGVTFEHFDMPAEAGSWDGDVLISDSEKAAWFKDPDGNTLCLHSR
jgi:catechol 2,3-dioxygenase-like lactoylglutathione lyase family enzyme